MHPARPAPTTTIGWDEDSPREGKTGYAIGQLMYLCDICSAAERGQREAGTVVGFGRCCTSLGTMLWYFSIYTHATSHTHTPIHIDESFDILSHSQVQLHRFRRYCVLVGYSRVSANAQNDTS